MSEEKDKPEEIGIPENMRVKRKYTMSEAALEQRRQAALQPKPGMAGIRNNFKTGVLGRIWPCKSTCSHFPCVLIDDGATQPGGIVLIKKNGILKGLSSYLRRMVALSVRR